MKTYYVRFGSGNPATNVGLNPTFLTFNNYGSAVTPPSITSVVGATGFYAFQYGPTTPIVFLIDGATTGLDATSRYVSGSLDPVDRMDEYGNSLMAYGNTLVGIGTTNFALGTTSVALGITNVALGTTNVAIGTTGLGYGATNLAIGTTALGYGVTNLAISTTLLGYGVSTYALATSIYAQSVTGFASGPTIVALLGDTSSSFGTDAVDPTTVFGYLKRMQEYNEGDQSFNKTTGVWTIQARNTSLLTTRQLGNSSTEVTRS